MSGQLKCGYPSFVMFCASFSVFLKRGVTRGCCFPPPFARGGLDAERGRPQPSKALPCDQTEGLRVGGAMLSHSIEKRYPLCASTGRSLRVRPQSFFAPLSPGEQNQICLSGILWMLLLITRNSRKGGQGRMEG